MARADKMYNKSPRLARDAETGKVKLSKEKIASKEQAPDGDDGYEGIPTGLPLSARHAMDRQQLYSRFETDHAAHDYGKNSKADKASIFERHVKDLKELYKKHHAEVKTDKSALAAESIPNKKDGE